MTPREQAAYRAGIEAVLDMAMIAAVTIEFRPDAGELRQRAAVAALQGLADGGWAALADQSDLSIWSNCLRAAEDHGRLHAAGGWNTRVADAASRLA